MACIKSGTSVLRRGSAAFLPRDMESAYRGLVGMVDTCFLLVVIFSACPVLVLDVGQVFFVCRYFLVLLVSCLDVGQVLSACGCL